MGKSAYYEKMFVLAAMWTFASAFTWWMGVVVIPQFTFRIFGMAMPKVLFPYHAMFWCIMVFGIGYVIVSRDITKNHGIVWVGLLGKISFFLDCAITTAIRQANVVLLLVGIVDLIFALLFLEFLRTAGKEPQKKNA